MVDTVAPKFGEEQIYLATLGKFIEEFASTEAVLRLTFWVLADIGQDVGRAVLSTKRTKQTIADIKNVVSVKNPGREIDPIFNETLNQLRAINEVRNALVHFNLNSIEEDGRTLTNSTTASRPEKAKTLKTSVELLDQMTADLSRIKSEFMLQLAGVDELTIELGFLRRARDVPWQFKPPAPGMN